MVDAHPGPVVGLHPMHGPDLQNLSKAVDDLLTRPR